MIKDKKKNTVGRVLEITVPIAEQIGVSIWDVRFEKEGASWFLRVILDCEAGVTFDHCEAVSRPLSAALDEEDFIEQSYYLEVSSPGLARLLKKPEHFAHCLGRNVIATRIRPDDNNQRVFHGTLVAYQDGTIMLETPTGPLAVFEKDCAHVKLDDDQIDIT